MRRLIWLLLLSLGCGGSAPILYTAEGAKAPRESAPAPRSASYGRASDDSAGAVAQGEARAERPGLGTAWGETISSHVREVSFDREASPFAELGLYYNDRRGVELQASRLHVEPRYERETSTGNGAVFVSIRDESGDAFETTHIGGRSYVVGREGEHYSIHVRSRSPERLEITMSVDGLDVIDGSNASPSHRGYVLMPYGVLDIEGFRKSGEAVAAFRFAPTSDSYAELRGEGRNVGVIGLAFFREQRSWRYPLRTEYSEEEIEKRNTADPFPHRYAPPPPRW